MLSEIAAFGDYRVLQGSVAYKHVLGIPFHGLLLGMNFWLDRGIGVNVSYDLQLEKSEGSWKSANVAAMGLEMTKHQTAVRCAIASNAMVNSSVTHRILQNMKLTIGAEVTMFPLTCVMGLHVDVESWS
jgi:hypothetical protein